MLTTLEPCPGCGALFPPIDGPTHRYIGASAGCWALYSPLVVGGQPDPALIAASRVAGTPAVLPSRRELGAFLVDAYAVQHHGDASPQAVQSVAVHLLTLHGILARGMDPARAIWLRLRPLRTRGVFRQLEPPPVGTALTVRHLWEGGGVERPHLPVEYVESVYAAWSRAHAETIAEWYERYVVAG